MNDNTNNTDFMQDIRGIVEQIQRITKEAVSLIEPQVNEVIRNKINDNNQIELLLDRLLDYAGMDNSGLILFKRLCRYYYKLNPKVAAGYVNTYRDLYDDTYENNDEE